MDGYTLSRNFFDWCFENPEKIHPTHAAVYFFAIEHCNRLGWKTKFGFPTQMTMDALGIRKHHTYIKYLNDLVEWGFIEMVEKSKNQYSANIISIKSAMPKKGEALGKARAKHAAKQGQSTGCIDKPKNNTNNINGADAPTPKSFKEWTEQEFYQEVAKSKDKYPKELLRDFYDYWREPNTRGRMRFQLQQTWDTALRLGNWSRRDEERTPAIIKQIKPGNETFNPALKNKIG